VAISANHYFAGSCIDNNDLIGRAVAGEYIGFNQAAPSGSWLELRSVRLSDTTDPADFLTVDFYIRDLSTNSQTGSRTQYTSITGCTPSAVDSFTFEDIPYYSAALTSLFVAAYAIRKFRQVLNAG